MANILYIDHDKTEQQLIQTLLSKQHNVIIAVDGPTAIQYCAMIQPDLVFLNDALLNSGGSALPYRLRMFMPQTPLVLITDAAPVAKDANFDATLIKPYDFATLQQTISRLLPAVAKVPAEISGPSLAATEQLETQIVALNQANKRLASLNAVGALIGSSLDFEHLTDEILGQIEKTIAFDSATLFLLKGDILEAVASRGFSGYRRGLNTYHRKDRNSAWHVVTNKLPLILSDVTTSEQWESRPELSLVKSWLGVPLIHKDRVVGVLTLDKNEPEAFTDADARYLFTLAYQIGVAVENVQLFQAWESQSNRLKLITEVAKEISAILNIDDLFETLAQTIFNRLTYDQVVIFEIDERQGYLSLKAVYGQDAPQLKGESLHQHWAGTIIEKLIQLKASLLINDVAQTNSPLVLKTAGIQSRLFTPIFLDQQLVAVIDVGQVQANSFADQDLWTLSSLASHATKVIENGQLYREVQSYSGQLERTVAARTQRLQAIKTISQVVSQGLAVAELLAVVGRGVSQIFSTHEEENIEVSIGLLSGQTLQLTTISGGKSWNGPKPATTTLPLNPQDPAGYVISRAKPVIINNIQGGLLSYPNPLGKNRIMIAPLITGGKTMGLIQVKCEAVQAFDAGDLETLESLAFQVASAIEHAHLLQKTREIAIAEERTRLARDMHDGVAQNLAYILLQVDRCLGMVAGEEKVEVQLERISDLLVQNIDELRRNIFDLRPVEFEGKTLFSVIEDFVSQFGRRWGVQTTCQIEEEAMQFLSQIEEVSPEVESSVYRILQETLSNARQHANSSQLSVQVAVEDEQWLTLHIEDNGCGFDVGQQIKTPVTDTDSAKGVRKGLGLISMRERAERIGGQFVVSSIPGMGTTVSAKLPLTLGAVGLKEADE